MKTPQILQELLLPQTKTAQILKCAALRRQSALDDDEVLAKLAQARKRGITKGTK